MYRFALLSASLVLSACASGPTFQGRTITEIPFKVDGWKTVMLPMTSAGAIPAENEYYKIETAGNNVAIKPGNPEASKLTWVFSFLVKQPRAIKSVVVEQVTPSGELSIVTKDDAVLVKNGSWVGRSKPLVMTQESIPWLYSGSNSTFVFKFTINADGQDPTVMYQPSLITRQSKEMYFQVMSAKK